MGGGGVVRELILVWGEGAEEGNGRNIVGVGGDGMRYRGLGILSMSMGVDGSMDR